MVKSALKSFAPGTTPQTEKAAKGQKKNNAGGYAFKIDKLNRVRRFLIMGSEGTFYQSGQELTRENAKNLEKLVTTGKANEVTDLIVEIATENRAAKLDYGLFALALVAALAPEAEERHYAFTKVTDVCRTASTLFSWMGYYKQFRPGGSSGFKKAIQRWYTEKDADRLAYQVVKYRNRAGFTHRDALRISHPTPKTPSQQELFKYATTGDSSGVESKAVEGFEKAKEATTAKQVAKIVKKYQLTWEMVPTDFLNEPEVLVALFEHMPYMATVRNLSRFAKAELLTQNKKGSITSEVIKRITNPEAIKKSGVHPLNLLIASKAYSGGSVDNYYLYRQPGPSWEVNSRIVQALEKAYYISFKNVDPTGKRIMLGIDVSGSMEQPAAGNLTAAEASAALAAVTLKTEDNSSAYAFAVKPENQIQWYRGGTSATLTEMPVQYTESLQTALEVTRSMTFGATDLALPMTHALENDLEVDAFVILTDNETYAGDIHPHEALKKYRKKTGIDAKLIVVAMTASRFSVADPNDAGSLDLAGFDSATPQIISDFIRGDF